jgi:dTDP-4-dehydrorhamnose reductase
VKVLITGASGQVGRALLSTAPAHLDVRALTHTQLDIGDPNAVRSAVERFSPGVLINAAAYTAVDRAESEPEVAMAINATAAHHLAEAMRGIAGGRLIQISTDYVFDGGGTEAHRPEDPTGPISVYGRSKLSGEQQVQEVLGDRAIVLRTAWVYAAEGKNFLLTMLRLMQERGAVRVVSDQHGSPTAAASVARALWQIVENLEIRGVLHWTDKGTTSWYQFARAIAEDANKLGVLRRSVEITPIHTIDFPTPAKRPLNSVLDLRSSAEKLRLQPIPWREMLHTTLRELANP